VATLRGRLAASDLTGARSAWLAAHAGYERLGAAYGTFGDLGQRIDGRPDGLPGGVADPGFTGLRRLEYGLYHGGRPASLVPIADRLAVDVAGLRSSFPRTQTDPNDLPLRAHEILEDAVQFELTGAADQGSGTGLAMLDAALDGTQAVLDALDPVLRPRYPAWPALAGWLGRARGEVRAARRPDGTWTAPAGLGRTARQRLDADVGQLLELLAPVAAIGDVRRSG
jgi:iron uptake system EfeUOB component EfeO/EfeM